MKKIKLLFTFVALSLFLTSCDRHFLSEGVVVDNITHQPIKGVRILLMDTDTTYTDSLGRYKIEKSMYGTAGDMEILLNKNGYQLKHVNLRSGNQQWDKFEIELKKSGTSVIHSIDRKYIKTMFYFNKYILSLLNILTLLFIIIKKRIEFRPIWIIGVLFFNMTFFISFTDCSLVKFMLVNGPIYLKNFTWYPYSLHIVIPFASIFFWILYFAKRDWVIVETENTKELFTTE